MLHPESDEFPDDDGGTTKNYSAGKTEPVDLHEVQEHAVSLSNQKKEISSLSQNEESDVETCPSNAESMDNSRASSFSDDNERDDDTVLIGSSTASVASSNVGNKQDRGVEQILGSMVDEMVQKIAPDWRDRAFEEALDVLQRYVNKTKEMEEEQLRSSQMTINHLKLIELDNAGYVANQEEFECTICTLTQQLGEGVVLKDCLHNFCKDCITKLVETSTEVMILCPHIEGSYKCDSEISQTEIKAIVPSALFEKYMNRSLAQFESQNNAFHCQTANCPGFDLLEPELEVFFCTVCQSNNCVKCKAIHPNMTCEAYQQLKAVDSVETLSAIGTMMDRGDIMPCPKCKTAVAKESGCDWLTCFMCKTEICWVTRGPRWGPGGRGDTTSGCRCQVNGVKCHQECGNCH